MGRGGGGLLEERMMLWPGQGGEWEVVFMSCYTAVPHVAGKGSASGIFGTSSRGGGNPGKHGPHSAIPRVQQNQHPPGPSTRVPGTTSPCFVLRNSSNRVSHQAGIMGASRAAEP